jgi:tetratricopeptide (TPR) repeat protein
MDLREKFEWAQKALSFYDFEEAEKIAWEIREARPDLASAYLLLGNIYTNTKRHQEAVHAYQQAVELESDSIEALNNLGIAYKKIGKLGNALEVFEKAHTLSPERPDITYNLANCRKELGDLKGAEILYRRTLEGDPGFLMAYNNLGNLLHHQGKTDEAIRIFREGLERDPNNPMLRYNLGIALESKGLVEEAIQEYRRSLKSKPGWGRALNNLGVSLQKTEHYQEAEQVFQDLLKVEKNKLQAYNNMGVLLFTQKKFEEAEQYFQKALSFDPGYKNAALNLGKLHVESGEAARALEELRNLVKQNPDNHDIRFELANLLFRTGKENAALNETIQLLHTEPNNPDYLLLLGKCRRTLGSHGKAIPPLEKALRLRPDFENALVELAATLSDTARHEEAIQRLDAYLEIHPDSFQVELCRAETELDRNSLGQALEQFVRLNDRYPGNERILRGLLNTFRKLGNRTEALRVAEELVHTLGDPQRNTDLDRLQAGLQLYEQILNDLEEDTSTNWQDNLRQLLETKEAEGLEDMDELEREMAIQSDEDIEGEMVPIIDVGGIEPVIAVNEEEGEYISLTETEEDIEPPEEEREEEEKPEKIALSPDQGGRDQGGDSSYGAEKNAPSWPEPQVPPPQPKPQPQPQPPYQPPQTQPPYQPPYQPPQYPQASGGPSIPPTAAPIQYFYSQVPPRMPLRESYGKAPHPDQAENPTGKTSPRTEDEEEMMSAVYPQDLETLEGALIEEEGEKKPEHGRDEPETEENAKDQQPLDQHKTEELFDYLAGLTEHLPEDEKREYEESDMRLRVEALRSRLNGIGGLHTLAARKTAETSSPSSPRPSSQSSPPSVSAPSSSFGPDKVGSVFQYLHDLSGHYPNPEIGEVLKRKMRDIIGKLKDSL